MTDTDPSWDLYRSFLAVVRDGSLSAAARTLGLTQPTIGRHIDALESVVGTQLFVRSRHGLAPTDAALELRSHAEAMASTAAALLRAASGSGGKVEGTVRIAASEVMGVEVLPSILAGLAQRHPGVVLELALSNDVADLLRRDADIAVRMVEPRQQALIAMRVGTIRIGLYAHRRYLGRAGTPRTFEELEGHALIGFDRESAAIRGVQKRIPFLKRSLFALRADSDLAQIAALRAGFGIGACQMALAARNRHLVRVLPGLFEFGIETSVVMHEDLRGNGACRAVYDALVAGLKAYVRDQPR